MSPEDAEQERAAAGGVEEEGFMIGCKYEGCRNHTSAKRYGRRPLLCRLSIHRHWGDCKTSSPPPWQNVCLQCGYAWIRNLNGKGERQRWAWWWKAPWIVRRPLLWLSYRADRHPWIRMQALLENRREAQ